MRIAKRSMLRAAIFLTGLAIAASGVVPMLRAADAPRVELSITGAGPRTVEESTANAIMRDYAAAWQAMTTALADNRDDVLGGAFVGIARDKLAEKVAAQRASGLRTRLVSKGHKLQAIFYSPEGSSMQLHDVATYEVQVLDGESVVHREELQQKYVALMTVAEGRWKVRVLESVPEFR